MTYLDNFQTLNFTSLLEPEYEKIEETVDSLMDVPGIIGIHFLIKNRTYITSSIDIGATLLSLSEELPYDYYELCPELYMDFSLNPSEYFVFVIISANKKFSDYKKLGKELRKIEKSWPYKLYKNYD